MWQRAGSVCPAVRPRGVEADVGIGRFLTIAMMGLVVEHEDIFHPIRSGMTRWSICPSVSACPAPRRAALEQRPPPLESSIRSRSLKAW